MAVIVMGAGATRGASFVDGLRKKGGCLPPLDTDFFTQLQRVSADKHQEFVAKTITDAVELFGNNFHVTLETMFTTIQHTLSIIDATGKEWRSKRTDFERKRTNLIQALAAVLEESLVESGRRDPRSCDHHANLVKHLKHEDVIVSLNYDCLIDYALRQHGTSNWNPAYGYCLPRPKGPNASIGEKYWSPKPLPSNNNTLRLLKLHGSMNFGKNGKLIKLKERPYTRQNNNLRPEIIPPEWNKKLDGHFQRIWRQAAIEIHKAKTIVFIGYSFPTADLHTAALFRVSVNKELDNVVIVNPDKDAQHRTLDVIKPGLAANTRVMCFDYFSEFAQLDRSRWERPKSRAATVATAKGSPSKAVTQSPVPATTPQP